MPTYEFSCKQCGNRFEVMVPSAKRDQVRCVQCESSDLKEIYGFNFSKSKGSDSGKPCAQSDSCPSKRFGFG